MFVNLMNLLRPMTLAVSTFLLSGIAMAQPGTHVTNLTSAMGAEACQTFGWSRFAYDGTANISFCAQYGSGVASYGVTHLTTHLNRRCVTANGYRQFAYNGRSRIYFCMKLGAVSAGDRYVSDVTATLGRVCPTGFETFGYDGTSNIHYCAKYRIR